MAGLFTTPQEILQAQALQREQQSRMQQPLQGQLFNLGYAGGDAMTRYLGGTNINPQQAMAQQQQQMLQGLDLTNRANVLKKVQDLSNQGLHAQAAELMKLAPAIPTPQEQWSEPYPVELEVGGSKQVSLFRRNLVTGKTEQVTSVTDKKSDSGSGNGPMTIPGIELKPQDYTTYSKIISNYKPFTSHFGSLSEEDLVPVIQGIKYYADKLKAQEVQAGGDKLPDSNYMNRAFTDMVKSGEISNYIKPSVVGAPSVDTPMRFTDQNDVQAGLNRANMINQAQQATTFNDPLAGNPSAGGFNRKYLADQGQADVFLAGGPEDIAKAAANQGYNMTPIQYESHKPYFEMISKNRPEVQKYLKTPDRASATREMEKTINTLQKSNEPADIQKSMELLSIMNYLKDFSSVTTKPGNSRASNRYQRKN